MTLDLEGQLWNVVEFQHVKPGKGPAFVRTKLKHVLSGKVVEKTFNAGVKVEVAIVEKRDMQYLYHDGDSYVFMDTATYDQINIPESTITKVIQFKTNLSFNDYLNSYRIEFLINKLKSTPSWFDFTIEAMALKSGFANRVTFNNALKKIKGQKPSELIKEFKNL